LTKPDDIGKIAHAGEKRERIMAMLGAQIAFSLEGRFPFAAADGVAPAARYE